MSCECDYSFICQECQTKIDIENQEIYQSELRSWMIDTIKKIAAKVGVEVDDPPKIPGRYS